MAFALVALTATPALADLRTVDSVEWTASQSTEKTLQLRRLLDDGRTFEGSSTPVVCHSARHTLTQWRTSVNFRSPRSPARTVLGPRGW